MQEPKKVQFKADLHGCINHACIAWVYVAPDGTMELNRWTDGYTEQVECSDKVFQSILDHME